mmetsp:Transcript_6786/g.19857  ORF Transcript_6786/g.19857 Transcript_6786/m.19857 type:complete len:201 (+) Transcript_6786:957-1559(+)
MGEAAALPGLPGEPRQRLQDELKPDLLPRHDLRLALRLDALAADLLSPPLVRRGHDLRPERIGPALRGLRLLHQAQVVLRQKRAHPLPPGVHLPSQHAPPALDPVPPHALQALVQMLRDGLDLPVVDPHHSPLRQVAALPTSRAREVHTLLLVPRRQARRGPPRKRPRSPPPRPRDVPRGGVPRGGVHDGNEGRQDPSPP